MSQRENDEGERDFRGVLGDTSDYVDLTLGAIEMVLPNGHYILEEDYRVSGEVWRVHKGDADPYPSNPHAHCVGGAKRFVGLTLHLGTAELYDGRKALGRFLSPHQFDRLIEMIRPKFPSITLPLPTA
ncbi:hypothetical protein [Caulobacter sp. LARHSG274]